MPICSAASARPGLTRQPVPDDERVAIERHVRELDRLAEDLEVSTRRSRQMSLDDAAVARLITITGVNLTVAAGIWRRSATSAASPARRSW